MLSREDPAKKQTGECLDSQRAVRSTIQANTTIQLRGPHSLSSLSMVSIEACVLPIFPCKLLSRPSPGLPAEGWSISGGFHDTCPGGEMKAPDSL